MNSKKCPGGYSIPADKDCRGSKEAFQGASRKLKEGLARNVKTARVVGSAARQAIDLQRTPEGRAAIKKAREVYGKLPKEKRKEMEARTSEVIKEGISREAKSRLSEAKEVVATGGSYAKKRGTAVGRQMLSKAKKAFRDQGE